MSADKPTDYSNFRSFLQSQKQAQPTRVTEYPEGAEVQEISESEVLRKQGNDLFNLGFFSGAVAAYTEAIKVATEDEMGKLYSNRSIAYLKDDDKEAALADAREAVRFLPTTAKSYNRLCSALLALGQYEECLENAEVGRTFGKGFGDITLEAQRGLFDKLLSNKTLVQDKNGLQVKWLFSAPNTLTFDILQKKMKAKYYVLPGSTLRVSSERPDMMPSQDYEFKIEKEQLWIRALNATSEPFALLQEEVLADLDEFESELAYMQAWLAALPDATSGEMSNVVPQDNEQVTQEKSEKRLLLIQELNQLKNRGMRFHGSAMGKVRTGKSKMCRELRRRMVALQLIDAETKTANAFVAPEGGKKKSRRMVISDDVKGRGNESHKPDKSKHTTALKSANETLNTAQNALCATNGVAVEADAVGGSGPRNVEVAQQAAVEHTNVADKAGEEKANVAEKMVQEEACLTENSSKQGTNVAEKVVQDKLSVTEKVVQEKPSVAEKMVHEELSVAQKSLQEKVGIVEKSDQQGTNVAEEVVQHELSVAGKVVQEEPDVAEKLLHKQSAEDAEASRKNALEDIEVTREATPEQNDVTEEAALEERTAAENSVHKEPSVAEKIVREEPSVVENLAEQGANVAEEARQTNAGATGEAALEDIVVTEEASGEQADAPREVDWEVSISITHQTAPRQTDEAATANCGESVAVAETIQAPCSAAKEPGFTEANGAQANLMEATIESQAEGASPLSGNGYDEGIPSDKVDTCATDEPAKTEACLNSAGETTSSRAPNSRSASSRTINNVIFHIARMSTSPGDTGTDGEGETFDDAAQEACPNVRVVKCESETYSREVAPESLETATVTNVRTLVDPQAGIAVTEDKMLSIPKQGAEAGESTPGLVTTRSSTDAARDPSFSGLLVVPTIFNLTPRTSTNTILPMQDEQDIAHLDSVSQTAEDQPKRRKFFTQKVAKRADPEQPEWLSRLPACFQGIGRLCWA